MKLDPSTTTVLTLDLQYGILNMVTGGEACIANAARVVNASRKAGFALAHVGIGMSPGYPEIAASNTRFSSFKGSGRFIRGGEDTRFHSDVFREGDTTVAKVRVSAFAGSPLQHVLNATGAKTLVLFGVATSGIVLSTVREAADKDYKLIVVADASYDRDEEVHRVLTTKVFPGQATVVSTDEFLAKYV